MSVIDNLTKIKSCKEDIKQAIIEKGVDMSNVAFTEYAVKISEIPTGGGGGDYLDIKANLTTYYSTTNSVATYAFAYCTSLQSVNLPNCVNVGSSVFQGCKSLTSVNLPNCITVENDVFNNCTSITSIDLPNCVTVGSYVFNSCSSLTSVNLPKCVSVGNYAFASCSSLTSIDLPNCSYVNGYTFGFCTSLTSVNLPICSYVGDNVFYYCSSLQSIDLPKVDILGWYAFYNCYNLSYVFAPNATSIDNYVFGYCSSLSTLDLRSTYSCTLKGSYAFSRTPFASGIGSIYIHKTVLSQFQSATNWTYYSKCFVGVGDATRPLLSFSDGVIYGDTGVIYSNFSTYLGVDKNSVISIDLPNCVSIGDNIFSKCYSLTSIDLPNCSYVGLQAFTNCSSLTSVNLPNCEYVDDSAFNMCKSLSMLELPMCKYAESMAFRQMSNCSIVLPICSYLGDYAFYNNRYGVTLTIGTSLSTVCETGEEIFRDTYVQSIFVPLSLVEAYKSAPYWSNYASKIFGI